MTLTWEVIGPENSKIAHYLLKLPLDTYSNLPAVNIRGDESPWTSAELTIFYRRPTESLTVTVEAIKQKTSVNSYVAEMNGKIFVNENPHLNLLTIAKQYALTPGLPPDLHSLVESLIQRSGI